LLNRKFAAVAIATGIMFGTSACNFMSPIATMEVYTPGDGTSTDFGDIAARNIFILVTPSGQSGLFGSFVNTSTTATNFEFDLAEQKFSYSLQANEKLDIGFNGNNALALSGLNQVAGSLADVTFVHNGVSVKDTIPLLDATFSQYAPLVNSLVVIAPTEAPK
jgi:hypothetical protein